MKRLHSAGATVVNEKADHQISDADTILVKKCRVAGRGLYKYVIFLKLNSVPPDRIAGLSENWDFPERLRDIQRVPDLEILDAGDADELIAYPDSGFITGTAGSDVLGDNLRLTVWRGTVNPRNPIVMKLIRDQMQKAENSRNQSCGSADQQQSSCELIP